MKIPKGPFHSITEALLHALLTTGEFLGDEELRVDDTQAIGLQNIPQGALHALLVVEADNSSQSKAKGEAVLRFKEGTTAPTPFSGMPLTHLAVFDLKGPTALQNFKVIGIEESLMHTITVHYYG